MTVVFGRWRAAAHVLSVCVAAELRFSLAMVPNQSAAHVLLASRNPSRFLALVWISFSLAWLWSVPADAPPPVSYNTPRVRYNTPRVS